MFDRRKAQPRMFSQEQLQAMQPAHGYFLHPPHRGHCTCEWIGRPYTEREHKRHVACRQPWIKGWPLHLRNSGHPVEEIQPGFNVGWDNGFRVVGFFPGKQKCRTLWLRFRPLHYWWPNFRRAVELKLDSFVETTA